MAEEGVARRLAAVLAAVSPIGGPAPAFRVEGGGDFCPVSLDLSFHARVALAVGRGRHCQQTHQTHPQECV